MSNLADKLSDVLMAFMRYYNVTTEDVLPPFKAYAEFASHNEQYFLVKAAKVADIDSNEYVYFATEEVLTKDLVTSLADKAWNDGLSKVVPSYGHRNSDVTLIIISERIEEEAVKTIKKLKLYKSYKHTFYGWSHFKLIAMDLSSKRLAFNRQGQSYKKVLNNRF